MIRRRRLITSSQHPHQECMVSILCLPGDRPRFWAHGEEAVDLRLDYSPDPKAALCPLGALPETSHFLVHPTPGPHPFLPQRGFPAPLPPSPLFTTAKVTSTTSSPGSLGNPRP